MTHFDEVTQLFACVPGSVVKTNDGISSDRGQLKKLLSNLRWIDYHQGEQSC